ncbi:MAG: transcriptional repressor [Cyclobacteriaceae bacterium]|nr:transcriptional repressor [Cyclobacteriaceae bacterium]
MKYSDYKKALKLHSLRITDCRIDVLERFYNNNHALSMKDLEIYLEDYDRVTLYRTINSFVEKGLLHRIPDDSGSATFGICLDTCTAEQHHHDHVHFKCNICGHIECLSDYRVPIVDLPGYEITDSNLVINGVCKQCKQK